MRNTESDYPFSPRKLEQNKNGYERELNKGGSEQMIELLISC